MAVEQTTSTQTTQIDPTIQPYLKYGLEEAQRLYQAGGPQYFTGQAYVGPSQATQTGLEALQARASAGSPLTAAAQSTIYGNLSSVNPALAQYASLYNKAGYDPASGFYGQAMQGNIANPSLAQTQQTASGAYLGGNQFFQGAFQPAAQAATNAFNTAIGNVASQASKAGRYGSGAMTNLQNQAANTLAQSLTGTAGQLAYQNYANERAAQESAIGRLGQLGQQQFANQFLGANALTQGAQTGFNQAMAANAGIGSTAASDMARQMQAAGLAPQMAATDYADIQQMLAAGQLGEGYQQKALDAQMQKYAYEQNLPQQQLTNYLNQTYGFPAGKTTSTQTPYFTNPVASALGTGLLGVQLLGGLDKLGTGGTGGLQSGWNWLSSGWGSPSNSGGYENLQF